MAEASTKQKRRLEGKSAQPKRKDKKGKEKRPVVPAGPKTVTPANLYLCECHGEPATKAPCVHAEKDKAEHKRSQSTLGSWRCATTKKPIKVRVRKNSQGEAVNIL